MSRADADVPSSGDAEFDRLANDCRAWLAERGQIIVGSGSLSAGPLSVSLHCDFGPPEQDKHTNQDYALAWRPATTDDRRHPRLVLALSDGLTNSFRSESAAALACWVSVRALIEAAAAAPKERATFAFNEAGQALGRLADEMARDPEASCPDGQFLSTWKYILKKGGLFQTTLTLAWLDEDHFRVAMIGDGGALWRGYAGLRAMDRILAACDLETQQVHALGPAERYVREFDCWREEPLGGPFLCSLFTDGIGRGIGAGPFMLLDDIERLQAEEAENPAQRFIQQAIRDRPKDFDDNVTLAVIRAE